MGVWNPTTGEDWVKRVSKRLDRLESRSRATPVGTYIIGAWTVAPEGYVLANGATVPRAQYPALFEVIGTTFGAGNGTTTFVLPNVSATGVRYAVKV